METLPLLYFDFNSVNDLNHPNMYVKLLKNLYLVRENFFINSKQIGIIKNKNINKQKKIFIHDFIILSDNRIRGKILYEFNNKIDYGWITLYNNNKYYVKRL
tara:strand:+ start:59 stop:364 length:306 start_codon:yes stop_codon:yes gene_type:complete